MAIHGIMIPARFLTTMGHFVATIMIFYSTSANVQSSLSTNYLQTDFDTLSTSLQASAYLAILCLAFELLSIFVGFTLFRSSLSVFYSLMHFVGSILVAWFILDAWGALYHWYIFGFFSLLPAIVEATYIVRILICKVGKF